LDLQPPIIGFAAESVSSGANSPTSCSSGEAPVFEMEADDDDDVKLSSSPNEHEQTKLLSGTSDGS